jgi:uncharacterized protein involved in exopolysaccharide biosynthesis
MKKDKTPAFVDYLTVIFKRRTLIYKIVIIGAVVSAIISLLIPNQYTASTTILPPNPQQDMMFGLVSPSIMGSFGGASGLTALLGGGTRPSDLFAAILISDRITGQIIRKYNLKKVFRTKTNHDTRKQLGEITRIGVTPEGMITVAVTWYNKHLAADIANSYIEELDKFNTEAAMTVGKKYRIFIERRLTEAQDSLAKTEEALRKFQEKHHTVALDVEIQAAIETIAQLKSQIILNEVKKGAWSAAGQAGNPYLSNINNELRELRRQLSKIEFGQKGGNTREFGAGFSVPFSELPEVSLEYVRLFRDVKVQEAIFELLTQQYEHAKIMEAKDTPTVQLLDRASPPEKKSTPKRTRIVVLVSTLCLILGIVAVFVLESFENTKKFPERYKQWLDIGEKIRSDFRSAKTFIRRTLRIKKKI